MRPIIGGRFKENLAICHPKWATEWPSLTQSYGGTGLCVYELHGSSVRVSQLRHSQFPWWSAKSNGIWPLREADDSVPVCFCSLTTLILL